MNLRLTTVAAAAATLALVLAACGSSESGSPSSGTAGDSAASSEQPGVDTSARDLLPQSVRDSGKLIVGTELSYPPDEFKDDSGKPTGWGIELIQAIAERLGLTADLRESQFDNILPGLQGGKYDVGWASFTDNAERQKVVDFVDYYVAGTQWASRAGDDVDPNNACGLTVAVGTGTYQETDDVPAKSDACVAAGKEPITIMKMDTQGAITTSVKLGRADAMSSDSVVTQYAVSQTDGALQLAGEIMDSAPFGMAVAPSNTDLRDALQAATQSLMDDGTYTTILTKWGVTAGAIDTATINGATN